MEAAVLCKELSSAFCDDPEGKDEGVRGGSRGRDICIHRADSLCCTAETNIIL